MIGVGLGIGIGSGSSGLSPAWLTNRLVADNGANLVGLWIGSDLIFSGADVTGCVGRVGGNLSAVTANYLATTVNGRQFLAPPVTPVAAQRMQANNSIVSTACLLVVQCVAGVASYETWEDAFSANRQMLIRNGNAAAFLVTAGGSTKLDGVASTTIPTSGLHIFEGANSNRVETGVVISGVTTGFERVARSPIGLVCEFALPPDAPTAAANLATVRRYFRIAS